MGSKLLILMGLVVAVVLTRLVGAKDPNETSTFNDAKYSGSGYGGYPGGGYGGYSGGGSYLGRGGHGGYPGRGGYGGGGYCLFGCCGWGYHGRCWCCSYAGEAVDKMSEAKPQN
ncbi:glycine-rich cell wall structural protein-like [Syzygium oleosum]|uniref:glycine-rich cell wall structural protein-like n=1 Tax=Syzygium oleosum TaxID=219896 RepID=UPI0011D22681|nr:glycine-rich cell wall structural protein-like [Syzygium oleosum]